MHESDTSRPVFEIHAYRQSGVWQANAVSYLCGDTTGDGKKLRASCAFGAPHRGVTNNACGLKSEKQGKRKRRNPLTVRLSDSEREIIRVRAQEAGVSLNAYIRASVLGSPYKPNHKHIEALRTLNLELTKQGGNLNQIARRLNSNLMEQADTNSMLGVMTRAYLQSHKAVRDALVQGNESADSQQT